MGRSNDLVDELKDLGFKRGTLMQMAKSGQLFELRCEMPQCYGPEERTSFEAKRHPPARWGLSADHYPQPKFLGGQVRPYNVRLAHVECNARDYGWRSRVKRMLEMNQSLEEIAEKLNARKVPTPKDQPLWSAVLVRQAYVS